MKRKIIFIFLTFFLMFVFFQVVSAACPEKGLVPCGTEDCPCTLCHLFVLIKNIVDKLIQWVAIPLMALMGFVSAIMFITAHGDPGKIVKARQAITSAIIGFIIVLAAWTIVNTFVAFASNNTAAEVFGRPWHEIDCK